MRRGSALGLLFKFQLQTATLLSTAAALNNRPIIGILTEQEYGRNRSFIVSSYVKFLECAGARVVPILSNSSAQQLGTIFSSINGVLFPGGGLYLNTSHYGHAGGLLYGMAKKANDEGDHFPIWGTCLGFQLLGYLAAGQDYSVLTDMDSENISLPVKFTKDAKSSRLFSGFSAEQIKWMSEESLTFNSHRRGLTLHTFNSTPSLNQFYTVLATSKDRNGTEFVASMEGKGYPFYGVQWHPEKSGFEWSTKESINHSQHAVVIMQMAANFFVSEARHSKHRFSSGEEERSSLIYAHMPTYTGDRSDYEQKYYF